MYILGNVDVVTWLTCTLVPHRIPSVFIIIIVRTYCIAMHPHTLWEHISLIWPFPSNNTSPRSLFLVLVVLIYDDLAIKKTSSTMNEHHKDDSFSPFLPSLPFFGGTGTQGYTLNSEPKDFAASCPTFHHEPPPSHQLGGRSAELAEGIWLDPWWVAWPRSNHQMLILV